MKTPRLKISVLPSAVALGLLCAVANATALTNPAPVNPTAPAALASPGTTNLTPAAAASFPAAPAGEDIRDIRQPRHFPTPWLWAALAAGVALLLAAAYAAWHWLRHSKHFQMTPGEIALQRLEEARRLMDPEHAREYCFAVSQIIRGYIEEQWRLHAPRLTTEEFLRELVEGQASIVPAHRTLLGDFLQHCDLAKFAGWRYSLEALAEMHGTGIAFVQQSAAAPTPATNNSPETTPAPAPLPANPA
jgi:hypothetical protein